MAGARTDGNFLSTRSASRIVGRYKGSEFGQFPVSTSYDGDSEVGNEIDS
jgi:hypothetical protein